MAPDTWSGIVTAGVAVVTIITSGAAAGIIAVRRVCSRLKRIEQQNQTQSQQLVAQSQQLGDLTTAVDDLRRWALGLNSDAGR